MKAVIMYDCDGITFPVLNGQEITFTTIKGAKMAFFRKVRQNAENGNLRRFFGCGRTIQARAFVIGNENHFLRMTVQTSF